MPKSIPVPTPKPASFDDLPATIQYVWHGVNDRANLRQFLGSPVQWAELDVNLGRDGQTLILRHDSYAELPEWAGEDPLPLDEALAPLNDAGKSIKLDFKIGGVWIDAALVLLDRHHVYPRRLWFNADLALLPAERTRALSLRYPGAIIQVPLNSVLPLDPLPESWFSTVADLTAAGINRWSIGWHYPERNAIVAALKSGGHEVNLYGVATLAEFVAAVDLRPAAVTADFNFPTWHLYGRGSGHGGIFYEYELRTVKVRR